MAPPSAGMDEPDGKPSAPPRPEPGAGRAEREGRLAKALRDNLRRRKGSQKPAPGGQEAD